MTETEHMPDRWWIPTSLKTLDWKEMSIGEEWEDGTKLLVVVPVHTRGRPGWTYEVSSITLVCDEGRFEIECESGPWGWDLEDVDYYVEITSSETTHPVE